MAKQSGPQGGAGAREAVEAVRARASVLTGVAGTLVDVLVTGGPGPARTTGAGVARGGGGGLGRKRNVKRSVVATDWTSRGMFMRFKRSDRVIYVLLKSQFARLNPLRRGAFRKKTTVSTEQCAAHCNWLCNCATQTSVARLTGGVLGESMVR